MNISERNVIEIFKFLAKLVQLISVNRVHTQIEYCQDFVYKDWHLIRLIRFNF